MQAHPTGSIEASARPGDRREAIAAAAATAAEAAAQPGVTCCADAAAFDALAAEWEALLARAAHRSAFLKHGWMSSWWQLIGAADGGCELYVLLARDAGGRLVGILPLVRRREGRGLLRRRVLQFLGSWPEAPEHLDAIVDEAVAAATVEALVAGLDARRSEFEAIELLDLAEHSLLLPALGRLAAARGARCRTRVRQHCPYIALSGSYDEYLKTLTQKHRYKLRLFGKRLAVAHDVQMEVASTPAEVPPALEEMFRLHAMRWTLKTDDVSGFDDPAVHAFHRHVAARLAAEDTIRVFLLRCDGRAVAACYCFMHDGRMSFFQPGFDPEFRKLHVGKVLLGRVVEYCYRNKLQEFDFLRGTEAYKFDWTQAMRPTLACDIALAPRVAALHAARDARRHLEARRLAWRRRVVTRLKVSPTGALVIAVAKKVLGRAAAAAPADD